MRAGKKTVFYMRIGISEIFLQEIERVEALLLFQILVDQIPVESVVSRSICL